MKETMPIFLTEVKPICNRNQRGLDSIDLEASKEGRAISEISKFVPRKKHTHYLKD